MYVAVGVACAYAVFFRCLQFWALYMTLIVLQNAVIEGQETPLRLSFAKDKPTERTPPTSTIASDALQVSSHG